MAARAKAIATHIERMRLGDLKLLPLNARYMRHETFRQLVENVRRDGGLTSVPFACRDGDGYLVLSGNHRVRAAIEAFGEDHEAHVMVTEDKLPKARRIAIQLAHNAIDGEDDPATLKKLYEQLDSIDWRDYSGLDDKTLELLDRVQVGALSEASLEFQSVSLAFLPGEADRARDAWANLKATLASNVSDVWVARLDDHGRTLDALDAAGKSYKVSNVATQLMILLDLVEAHMDDLQAGYLDDNGEPVEPKRWVPLETIFGPKGIPADSAAVVVQAVERMRQAGEITSCALWRAIELWAADYLAGN